MSDTQNNTNLTAAFETTACGRCGGSGQYSYCQMHGTRCFGCAGKGLVYTKRAEAALAYARTLRTVKVSEVQVGWLLFDSGGPFTKAGWFTVTAVGGSNSYSVAQDGTQTAHYDLTTKQCVHGMFPDSDVQAVPSKARLQEVRALALAFQATLAPNGKVAPVYTPEQQAKRAAAQAKRDANKAKREAIKAAAAAEARAAAELVALAAAKAEQARLDAIEAAQAAERAVSQHIGTVGERREFTLTVEFTVHLEAYAYGWAASTLYICRDEQRNRVVYKGSSDFLSKGETGVITATVKDHTEYKGERQTVIARPKVARAAEPEAMEVGA